MDVSIIFYLIILIFSVIIHEIAHGSVANVLGDPTAKNAGRLSLNPLKHLDFFGSFLVPFFLIILQSPVLIGWAKPVPINPFNFKNPQRDEVKVALAGPLANFSIALIFGLFIRFISLPEPLLILFSFIVALNLVLAIFNLIPLPPLDGSHLLFSVLSPKFNKIKLFLHQYGLLILFFFIFFCLSYVFLLVRWIFLLITGQPLVI
ncbi:MAG: site-2 protease family protein [Minisyncoccales bacterium]